VKKLFNDFPLFKITREKRILRNFNLPIKEEVEYFNMIRLTRDSRGDISKRFMSGFATAQKI